MAKRKLNPKTSKKAVKSEAAIPEVLPREGLADQETEGLSEDQSDESSEDLHEETEGEIVGETLPSLQGSWTEPDELDTKQIKAISPSDPLRRYMEEVKRYSLLSPEEEFQLAMQLKADGNLEAAKKLVQANLRLVVKIAFEYNSLYSNLMDLIQEGNIGLMKAVSKFDPTKGARLSYYSSWWIRSYILKYLLDNFRLIKIGTTQAQKKLFYQLLREKDRLEAQGLLAGPKLLAEKLDVREKDVIEMQQRLSSRGAELSIDTPIGGESETTATYASSIPDEREGIDEGLAREELLSLLKSRLPAFQKLLGDKELKILKERILAEEPKTLQEVADLYGLTRERVRQIEVKVVQKLREFLSPDLR